MMFFKYKMCRFIFFVVLWFGTGFVINVLNQPTFKSPNEYFMICADKLIKDHQMLPAYYIQDYQRNPQNFKPCQPPFKYQADNGYTHLTLSQPTEHHYLLSIYNDSMSDPMQYHYRIINGMIEPLGWRYGGNLIQIISYIYGLIVSAIIYYIIKHIYQKKHNLS